MKVIVAGCDYRPRPHMVSWFAKAFRRLGCDVVVVSSEPDGGEIGDSFVDPQWEVPQFRQGRRDGGTASAASFVGRAGGCDLFVMVDCGNEWAAVNDAGVPYVYVWREGNPAEFPRVGAAAGSAPVFCCMINKGTLWPDGTRFMPFAVDRALFHDGAPFEEREWVFCYTGRERGNSYDRWKYELKGPNKLVGYVDFVNYLDILRRSKTTAAVDSNRYLASRGLEAMACGQVVFWDDGETLARAGLVANRDYLVCKNVWDGNECIPALDAALVARLTSNRDWWTFLSENARRSIAVAHTYEHRCETLATAVGLKLPRPPQEVAL